MTTETVLSLTDVHKHFGASKIIQGVDLDIRKGERHAIIGPNGAGKSTLFNLISGFYPISSGRIELKGNRISNKEPYKINRMGLSRSFQITNIFPQMSVFENVRCALMWPMGYRYSFWNLCSRLTELNKKTREILRKINLIDQQDLPASILSYADQRALEIGITVAGGADVILLDEPTAGMSNTETEQAVELILDVTQGKTLLMVEHDMSVVFNLADRISVLVYGELIATDTPDRIRNNTAVQEAYLGKEEF
jgi:branched-chain amino acid transport system ATP-binding protein